jgi:hypothetical protein
MYSFISEFNPKILKQKILVKANIHSLTDINVSINLQVTASQNFLLTILIFNFLSIILTTPSY